MPVSSWMSRSDTVRKVLEHHHRHAGFGTIEYRPADTTPDVHGVVLDITVEELAAILSTQTGYALQDVAVLAETGDVYISKTLMSLPGYRLPQEAQPMAEYMAKIRQGAQFHNLPAAYQVNLQLTKAPSCTLSVWHTHAHASCSHTVSSCICIMHRLADMHMWLCIHVSMHVPAIH